MSIANIFIEKDRATICVDTLAGYMQEGRHLVDKPIYRGRHSGKVSLFPQFESAMTHRGDGLLTSQIRSILEIGCPHDFDDAVGMMPEVICESLKYSQNTRNQYTGLTVFPGADIVLVGWSPKYERYLAVRWLRYPHEAEFNETWIDDRILLPEIDRLGTVDTPQTDEEVLKVMQDQVNWAGKEHPDLTCGGRVLRAELTRGSVSVRTIGELEQPAEI